MRFFILTAALFISACAFTQDAGMRKLKEESRRAVKKDPNDTAGKKWKSGGLISVNLSQSSLSNWAAGGDKFSLSANSLISLFLFYKEGRRNWDNTLDWNFGYVRTTSLGNRKNDDRVDLLSKYGYRLTQKISLASLFNFRSQLFKGYTYPNDSTQELSSNFMSPATILLSFGLDYQHDETFSLFFSPATARWIVVKDDSISAKGGYGVEAGRSSKMEFGAFLTANFKKDFNEVVSYKGRLDLFSNFRNKPANVDVFCTNLLSVKLTRALSVSWNVDLIYDDDVRLFGDEGMSPALQFKSIVGVGLLLKFPGG